MRLGPVEMYVAVKRLQFDDQQQTQQFLREIHLHKVCARPCCARSPRPALAAGHAVIWRCGTVCMHSAPPAGQQSSC